MAGKGNPNWIEAGWGEETKAVKLPIRLADKIRKLRAEGAGTDDLLALLDQRELDLNPILGEFEWQIKRGKIPLSPQDKEAAPRILQAILDYWKSLPS